MSDTELRWSTEPPTVPGVYRYRRLHSETTGEICELDFADRFTDSGPLVFTDHGVWVYADRMAYEWSQRFVPEAPTIPS